jgi:hypothetical protein
MRRPGRKALLWFGLALGGVLLGIPAMTHHAALGDVWSLLLGVPAVIAIPVGIVFGIMATLSAVGESRLRRGIGRLARWEVPPAEWEAFRRFETVRSGAGPGLAGDDKPRPAEGRAVEVLFGPRQVIVDGSYHPLRRWAIPELGAVGWLAPAGAPEMLEFHLVYPRGRYGGTVRLALRIPVPRAAREEGVLVFHHFEAMTPKPRLGLAFRRPWLVIGWGLAIMALSLIAGGIGWLLHHAGDSSDAVAILMIAGIMAALGAAFFTAIIVVATQPWKRRG